MKLKKTKKLLFKINVITAVFIIIANIILFNFTGADKANYTLFGFYISGFLLILYLYLLNFILEKDIIDVKKEAIYTNYPINIALFFCLLFIILIFSTIALICVNKEAANITFIFTFFMSTLSMLFPSLLLIAFIYFIVPAFIIPAIDIKYKNKNFKRIIKILLCLLIFLCIFNLIKTLIFNFNIEKHDKYKCSKLPLSYSTEFLKLNGISNYAKKLMSRNKVNIPLFYTTNYFSYNEAEKAEYFCNSINSRMPNYLETYNIVFNRFDTFGEKYYWTANKDGNTPLVLHYKNMSYEIIKKPKNVKPLLYCVADINKEHSYDNQYYFYRNKQKEENNFIQDIIKKPFNSDNNENKITPIPFDTFNNEKKHVNFSVKEVPYSIFKQLTDSGYSYNPSIKIKQEYETNDLFFNTAIKKNTNNIRLCFYPFINYSNISRNDEKEIWAQSFCSPAFDLINITPVLKTKNEKELYCRENGGRLPNIPELNGILKTLGIKNTGVKYWTNNIINNNKHVLVYYEDERFMKVDILEPVEVDQAYTFCIKESQNPSRVIANYKSRFPGIEGSVYAKTKCSYCKYLEMPDTVLKPN